jgi:lysophospholipase L1-like esterase
VGLSVAVVLGVTAVSDPPGAAAPERAAAFDLVVIGDSQTDGTPGTGRWHEILADELASERGTTVDAFRYDGGHRGSGDLRLWDWGVSGHSAAYFLSALPHPPVVPGADMVIVALGATDALAVRDQPEAVGEAVRAFHQNLTTILNGYPRARCVLVSPWDWRPGIVPEGVPNEIMGAFRDEVQAVATERGCAYATLNGHKAVPPYAVDGLHPVPGVGHQLFADVIRPAVQQAEAQ